jgi:hypothetical protein
MGAVRELVVILRAANKRETALAALRQVETVYPGNVWLQSEVKILASEIALAEAAAARPAVMIAAIDEHPFFEKLNHAIAQKNWAEAQRVVREVRNRRPAPEWLAARDAELWWAQLRIEHGLGDRLAGLITAKVYLDGSEGRAQGVLSLAQELYATGKKDEAWGLVREVLRKTPGLHAGGASPRGVGAAEKITRVCQRRARLFRFRAWQNGFSWMVIISLTGASSRSRS